MPSPLGHGLIGLAKVVAKEGAQHKVRANVICPGFVKTPLVEKRPTPTPPEVLAKALEPEDVAQAALSVAMLPSRAYVPDCPDWSNQTSDYNNNATHSNFGCAVNGNLAAMVADPEHLLKGAAGSGETVVMSSNKAIQSYRDQEPSGSGDLPGVATN